MEPSSSNDEAALLTQNGVEFLKQIVIALPQGNRVLGYSARPICKACFDWSERRPHIAGKVGAALCAHCLEKGWVRRLKGTRALETTPKGRLAFRNLFGIMFEGGKSGYTGLR
jgi:hypothetical protein